MPRRHHQFRIWFALAIITCVASGGCAIFKLQPIDVIVLDAESEKPIANAQFAAYYSLWNNDSPFSVWTSPITTVQAHKRTDGNGRSSIVATDKVRIRATAPDYLVKTIYYATDVAPNPEMNGRKATVRLYHGPTPTITIIVPDGYRGPLLIERLPIDRWIAQEVGQRKFIYHASDRGYVRIEASPLLLDFNSTSSLEIRAQYVSGNEIRAEFPSGRDDPGIARDEDIALRTVVSSGLKDILVIGTKQDKDNLSARMDGDPRANVVATDRALIDELFSAATTIGR